YRDPPVWKRKGSLESNLRVCRRRRGEGETRRQSGRPERDANCFVHQSLPRRFLGGQQERSQRGCHVEFVENKGLVWNSELESVHFLGQRQVTRVRWQVAGGRWQVRGDRCQVIGV